MGDRHTSFLSRGFVLRKGAGVGGRPALHSWWKHLLTGIMIPTVRKWLRWSRCSILEIPAEAARLALYTRALSRAEHTINTRVYLEYFSKNDTAALRVLSISTNFE